MKKLTGAGPLLGAVAAVGAACLAYGVVVEPNAFRLRRLSVPVLPAGHSPIRVLHISDLHLLPGQTRKIAWVRSLAGLDPHLVVDTGDNIAGHDALPALAEALGPLAGIPGVFVFGSNDYYGPAPINPLRYFLPHRRARRQPRLPSKALALNLGHLGWTDVAGRQVTWRIADTVVEIRGTGDAHIRLDDYESVAGPSTADVLIGVTHAPYSRLLDPMTEDGAALIMAGHTHGGQVCWPGGRALTTNCDLPNRQARGLSRHHFGDKSAYLHVSAGLGTSPYAPYRFCCPPEATLLTLEARP